MQAGFVRTLDTDVLVILIGLFHDMIVSYPSAAIWIGLGMGKYVQYISVNSTCAFLGPETSRALPMFHSFTGCDTTSCFFGKGKKSAWEAWKSFPDVTEAFAFLRNHPYYQLDVDDSIFKLLERFTVVLYDKASNVLNVNETRKEIFNSRHFVRSEIQTVRQLFYCSNLFHVRLSSNSILCVMTGTKVTKLISNFAYVGLAITARFKSSLPK